MTRIADSYPQSTNSTRAIVHTRLIMADSQTVHIDPFPDFPGEWSHVRIPGLPHAIGRKRQVRVYIGLTLASGWIISFESHGPSPH